MKRIANAIEALPEVSKSEITVFRWLENVDSAEDDVKRHYSKLLGMPDGRPCDYLVTRAQRFGYVQRTRAWWGRTQAANLRQGCDVHLYSRVPSSTSFRAVKLHCRETQRSASRQTVVVFQARPITPSFALEGVEVAAAGAT